MPTVDQKVADIIAREHIFRMLYWNEVIERKDSITKDALRKNAICSAVLLGRGKS